MDTNEVQILLVEDNKTDALLIKRALEKHNLANHLTHLTDGVQALDFIFGKGAYLGRNIIEKPCVIILDIKMPKISGLEVLGVLKSDERTKLIPVVILSSSREEKDILESYRLGVNSYVVKSVDYDAFAKSIVTLGIYWLLINTSPQH